MANKIKFKFNKKYGIFSVLVREKNNRGYNFYLDDVRVDPNDLWQIVQEYIEWYQQEYSIEPHKLGFIAVRAQSTKGPFIIERARETNLGNSLAEWYGIFFSRSQARHIAKLLNLVLEYEEV